VNGPQAESRKGRAGHDEGGDVEKGFREDYEDEGYEDIESDGDTKQSPPSVTLAAPFTPIPSPPWGIFI